MCRRFNIDNSARTKHGALLDAELLSEVYLELLGGAEPTMKLEAEAVSERKTEQGQSQRVYREPRNFPLSEQEIHDHEEFLQNKITDAIWLK